MTDIYLKQSVFFFNRPGLRFRLISAEAKSKGNIEASVNEDNRFCSCRYQMTAGDDVNSKKKNQNPPNKQEARPHHIYMVNRVVYAALLLSIH